MAGPTHTVTAVWQLVCSVLLYRAGEWIAALTQCDGTSDEQSFYFTTVCRNKQHVGIELLTQCEGPAAGTVFTLALYNMDVHLVMDTGLGALIKLGKTWRCKAQK